MNSSKIFISVGLKDFEGTKYEKSAYHCDILLNSATIDTLEIGEKRSRSIIPILSPNDRVRFVIKLKKTKYAVGFISFPVKTFLARKGTVLENWVTLFDSSNDDEYDGDFTEDDEEDPRVLFSFWIDTSANIRKMEESLLEDEQSVENEERMSFVEKSENDISSNIEGFPPKHETQISGFSKFVQEQETEVSGTLQSQDMLEDKSEQRVIRLQKVEKGKDQNEPSLTHSEELSELSEKSSDRMKNSKEKEVLVERKSHADEAENAEESKESSSVSDDLSATSSDDQGSVMSENTEDVKKSECDNPTVNDESNDIQTKEETTVQEESRMDSSVVKSTAASQEKIITPKENKAVELPQNTQKITSNSDEKSLANDFFHNASLDNKSKILPVVKTDQNDTTQTSEDSLTTQEKALEKNTFQIENHSAQNNVSSLKVESDESYKLLVEENAELKSKIKELGLIIDSKTQDLLAMHKRVKEIQDIQKQFEDLNAEKHNFKIQSLETLIKNLREELHNSQAVNKELKDDNKSLSIYQSKLLYELNKLNEDHLQKQQKLSQENAEMKSKLQAFEQKLVERDQAIGEKDQKLEAWTVTINSLEAERQQLLAKIAEIEKLQATTEAEESVNKTEENTVLASLKNEIAEKSYNNLLLKREIENLRGEKAQLEADLEQIKSRNYEHKIKKLQKKLSKSEKTSLEVREELSDTQKKLKAVLSEQENKFAAFKAENEAETQHLKLEKEEQDKENKSLQDENQELKLSLEKLKESCRGASDELAKQQEHNAEQRKTINLLNNKLLSLEKSLNNAFGDIQKLEASLRFDPNSKGQSEGNKLLLNNNFNNTIQFAVGSAKHTSSLTKKDSKSNTFTEIDAKLREFLKENKLPIKFEKLTDRVYAFGSKKVRMKIVDDKLVVKVGGGYVYIESFIKMYASHELNKLKLSKENAANSEHYRNKDNVAKEIEEDEDCDFEPMGYPDLKSKSKERLNLPIKLQRTQLSDSKSESKHNVVISSLKTDREFETKKESCHRVSKSFKFDNIQTVTKSNEAEHMVITMAEDLPSTRRKIKQTEAFYYDISPNYNSQKKSANRASHELSSDDFRKKSPIERFALRREKSPIDSQKDRIESALNPRDISPYQKNTIPKLKTNKELAPVYFSSAQRQ